MPDDLNTGNAGQGTPAGGQAENGSPTSAASGTPGQGAGAAGTGAAAAGGQNGNGAAAGSGATGANNGAGAAPRTFTYQEDRSNWLPPHRMREASNRLRTAEAQITQMRQQIAALTGVQLPDRNDQDPESQAIRSQFAKMFPGLAKLEAMADKLEKLTGIDPETITAQHEYQWTVLGNRTLQTLTEKMQETLGGDLSPFARRQLAHGFAAWIQSDDTLGERYAMQDPTLIAEYIKEYQTGVLDPFRRKATAPVLQHDARLRRVPRQGAGGNIGGAPANKPKPGDPNYEDSVHDAGWAAFNQG